jgi:alpha-beta hydrolase superfamily lysophospholipase
MQAIARQIAAARKLLRPLDLSRKPVYREEVREYFKYYGLDFPRVAHYFGLLRSQKARLATHVFVPKRYRATVVLVHGYLEHGGYFRHAVRRLLEERYAVVLFDLPGHGLSSGSPATIRDFSQYAQALALVVRFSAAELKKSVHLIGHSMGGSAVIELLLAGDAGDVDKVVLAAPLVHSSMWAATKLAYPLLAPLVEKVPRMFPALSHDRKFMEFTASHASPGLRGTGVAADETASKQGQVVASR